MGTIKNRLNNELLKQYKTLNPKPCPREIKEIQNIQKLTTHRKTINNTKNEIN